MTADQPPVSVVIPALNEEATIAVCLEDVLAQDRADIEVLVVDGGSTDRTRAIVGAYAERDDRVRLLDNPRGIIPAALNVGLEHARGRWLVRVDAHSRIPRDYVARVVGHLETGRWGGVGGRKDGVGRTPAGRAIAAALGSRFGVGDSTYHYGTEAGVIDHVPFGSYPVALALELGGWDETLLVNEDHEFDQRVRSAGRELLFDPSLRIRWESRQSLRDLFAQYRRYGRGKVRAIRRNPDTLRVRHVVPPALVAELTMAAMVTPWRRRLGIALVAPYAVALTVASARVARQVPRDARPYVAGAFLAMHVGWGLGFWEGLLGSDPAEATRRRDR